MAITDTFIGNVKGKKGDAGEITSVTASVANNVGTPSCNVTLGGTPSERTINLAFSGLKGEKGDTGSIESFSELIVDGDLEVNGDIFTNGISPVVKYIKVQGGTKTGASITSSVANPYTVIKQMLSIGVTPIVRMDTRVATGEIDLKLVAEEFNRLIFTASVFNSIDATNTLHYTRYSIILASNNAWQLYVSKFTESKY